MKRTLTSLLLLSLGLSAGGCKQDPAPAPAPTPAPAPAKPAAQTSPPPVAEPRADPACAAPLAAGPSREVSIAGRKAVASGTRLTFTDPEPGAALTLGVLGPINEDSGQNLVALRKYLRFFEQEKVNAILVTGDIAETAAGIERVLTAVAASRLPVFAVIGNRECRADFTEGLAAAQKASDAVVNLNAVRVVEFPQATLVSLPGYHDPNYLGCDTGCLYQATTVAEVESAAKEAKGPVLLVSHGPPSGEGSQALDHATSGGNVGDPAMRRLIETTGISFGVFSNIKEAGARAVDSAAGTTLVKEGVPSKRLFINPGPADTANWPMNDGTKSAGMAAVLRLEDGQARWKSFRAKAPTAAEQREAKRLAPPPRAEAPVSAPADGRAGEPATQPKAPGPAEVPAGERK